MSKKSQLLYNLTKRYLLFGFRRFYDSITVVGKENLPSDDCAVIFAPNHLNALMDALSVLYILPRNSAVTFVAKADLFSTTISERLMQLAKILPAYRKTDGMQNLGKNEATFDLCIKSLNNGTPVCIMPEGGQGEQHYIRPLVKGIFRIAFEAQNQMGNDKPVKIIPIGIDMSDLIKSNSELIINIGKPIDIIKYTEKYHINPSVAINEVKKDLHQALSELTLNISSKNYYDTIKFITDIESQKFSPERKDKNPIFSKFTYRQEITKKLLEIEEKEPSLMKSIDENVIFIKEKLKNKKLNTIVFSNKQVSVKTLIFGLPFFIFGFITNFLPMQIPVWIRKAIRVEYDGFYSSIHFGIGIFTFPIFYLTQAYLFYTFIINNIWYSILFFGLEYVSLKFAVRWWRNCQIYRTEKIFLKQDKYFECPNFYAMENAQITNK